MKSTIKHTPMADPGLSWGGGGEIQKNKNWLQNRCTLCPPPLDLSL